jgi:threonyl-tRNA synthetase
MIASCKLELLDFEHEEGKAVFWHSSAHVLGEACEKHYGCHLCIGPPIEDGFYYEMAMKDERYVYTSWIQRNCAIFAQGITRKGRMYHLSSIFLIHFGF